MLDVESTRLYLAIVIVTSSFNVLASVFPNCLRKEKDLFWKWNIINWDSFIENFIGNPKGFFCHSLNITTIIHPSDQVRYNFYFKCMQMFWLPQFRKGRQMLTLEPTCKVFKETGLQIGSLCCLPCIQIVYDYMFIFWPVSLL